jgi:hypothetical protein
MGKKRLLASHSAEISFVGEVPLVPEVCPIVILSGSDYDMGYQYAQELVHIYGTWILEQIAGTKFTDEQLAVMKRWEGQLAQYAPEIIEMCRGWADGATDAGVPTSCADVQRLFTGAQSPATDYMLEEESWCSGSAAWGKATSDGKLICSGATDEDCTFHATIVAFPKTGNNFIYTPFGALGNVPGRGNQCFAGHPGMNNKGLAYVHHGNTRGRCEPQKYWGYGIRRGAATFHILRFANSIKEAEEMILSWPIGDVGRLFGSPGGFFADTSGNGFVMECKKDPLAIRRAGDCGEVDFLYSTNNNMHKDLGHCEFPPPGGYKYEPHLGWYILDLPPGTEVEMKARHQVKWSVCRNLHFWDMFHYYQGHVSMEFMKMLWRFPYQLPASLEETEASFISGGYWPGGPEHRSNAFVSIMKPDDGDQGLYLACIGPAARDLTPIHPGGFYYHTGETNTFWELQLASEPPEVAAVAKKRAQYDLYYANAELAKLTYSDVAYAPLLEIFDRAVAEYERGKYYELLTLKTTGNELIYNWAKTVRAFTRCQVHAKRVKNALVPPPRKPEELGLKPFKYWETTSK